MPRLFILVVLLASTLSVAGCSKAEKGERGEPGPTGDRGEAGPPGPAGSSAIHVRSGRGPDETFCPLGEHVVSAFCISQTDVVSTPTFVSSGAEPPDRCRMPGCDTGDRLLRRRYPGAALVRPALSPSKTTVGLGSVQSLR